MFSPEKTDRCALRKRQELDLGLCFLCVKIKTFLCEESILPITKEICSLPYPDDYSKNKHYITSNYWAKKVVNFNE